MSLPWINLQILYAHTGWAMVLAACGMGLLARRHPFPRTVAAAWLVLAFVSCALPGAWSPAYWLGLACHLPSCLLVACCTVVVWRRVQGRTGDRVLPAGLALALAAGGVLLYADSWGWLQLGLYVRGFGVEAAFAGLMLGAAAVVCVVNGLQRGAAMSVLLALMLFALCRLPTGNLWDALLDPLLWAWACGSLAARAWGRRRPRGAMTPSPPSPPSPSAV